MTLSVLSFSITLLKVLMAVFSYFQRQGLIDEGRRQVILENALALARQQATKKEIQEHVDGLSDDQVFDELRDLEPK
jgi:hypothetical protein